MVRFVWSERFQDNMVTLEAERRLTTVALEKRHGQIMKLCWLEISFLNFIIE